MMYEVYKVNGDTLYVYTFFSSNVQTLLKCVNYVLVVLQKIDL